MTDTAQPAKPSDRTGLFAAVIAGVVILGGLFFLGGSERPLNRAATGFDALVSWLKANDVEARPFHGGQMLITQSVGLRVLPLYDLDMTSERSVPETREEMIEQISERDLTTYVYRTKLRTQPTLVVLPKWRTGLRVLGVAHQDLLIPENELRILLRQLGFKRPQIHREPDGFSTRDYDLDQSEVSATLLHAQTISAGKCETVIGTPQRALLLKCGIELAPKDQKAGSDQTTETSSSNTRPRRANPEHWILTDPDLMANHGLALGENGDAALAIIKMLKTDKPVIVDWTDKRLSTDNAWRAEKRERTWEDLARLFAWPFTMIWIAFAVVGGLVLWRAVMRYGPLAPEMKEEPLAAKTTAIDAKARLLRLTGHDGPLLRDHIAQRLQHLAAELLGPHRPTGSDPMAALRPLLKRTNPDLAAELDRLATVPAGADPLRHLDQFETCTDRIRDEFGRPTDLR